MAANYPNHFNPVTTIRFGIPQLQQTRLLIHNSIGQIVTELLNETLAPGNHQIQWDATNQSGQPVSSGIYFYTLVTGDIKLVRKMLLLQ